MDLLRLSFLVLRAKVFVPAPAAAGHMDRVACVAVHAYLDVKERDPDLNQIIPSLNGEQGYRIPT